MKIPCMHDNRINFKKHYGNYCSELVGGSIPKYQFSYLVQGIKTIFFAFSIDEMCGCY